MSERLLSVVIPSFNDPDIENTLSSLWNSLGDHIADVETIVVDDLSAKPVVSLQARVIRNTRRIGCGPSRYVGAMHAKGQWLLFVDAHSRFPAGWFDIWARECGMASKTLYCGSCLALPPDGDVTKPIGKPYFGATWNFAGPDRVNPRENQVLECIWGKDLSETSDADPIGWQLPAIMGAQYFVRRDWFIELQALLHLRLWSGDEQELSLKAWLAGGSIRFLKNVRIGHRFREGKVSANFVSAHHIVWNKLFLAWTCLPPAQAQIIQNKLQRERQFNLALKALHADWALVETQRAYNATIFTRSFQWLLERFALSFPDR